MGSNFNTSSTQETKAIIGLIDLTSLGDNDTEETITALCAKAKEYQPAAICIWSKFIPLAAKLLQGESIKIATVVNFPSGKEDITIVTNEIKEALDNGANEIDVVFPYNDWLSGKKEYAKDFIDTCKEVCGNATMKVILETGELKDANLIYEATCDAIIAGADFVKTSTGKTPVSATYEGAEAVISAVKDIGLNNIGVKISGGVASKEEAIKYLSIAKAIMGNDFITPKHFRFGASRLLDNLANEIIKERQNQK